MDKFPIDSYLSKSNRQLKEICKNNNIIGITGKNKDGLINLIRNKWEENEKHKNEFELLMKQIYRDESIPSQEKGGYWIHWSNERTCGDGKWMLFFNKSIIDEKWNYFKKLYDSNKLNGIVGMKVSTSKENPRATDKNSHVIILYCKGCEEETIEIGKNIVNFNEGYNYPYIYYKTNIQTREGTRATGQEKNYTYKLLAQNVAYNKIEYSNNVYLESCEKTEDNSNINRCYCYCGRKTEDGDNTCSLYPMCNQEY